MLVLVHSPALGPASWREVAAELARAGRRVSVPSLLGAVSGGPPSWSRVAVAVADVVSAAVADDAERVVLVAHSGAGLYVPVLVESSPVPVAACLLVDAGLPPPRGSVPLASPPLFEVLRGLADGDVLPPWTRWWPEHEVTALFPGAAVRRAVESEQPQLSLDHFRQELPVPDGWDSRPCAYLAFGDTYAAERDEARRRGWPVATLPGRHLHQLVDPAGVAAAVLALLSRAGRSR